MSEYEPYSRRRARLARADTPTMHIYDPLPEPFRVQVVLILDSVLGKPRRGVMSYHVGEETPSTIWGLFYDLIMRERGVFTLYQPPNMGSEPLSKQEQVRGYLAYGEASTPELLDAIEIAFRVLHKVEDFIKGYQDLFTSYLTPLEGIAELNKRFRQHALGYAFNPDTDLIVRLDSEYLHVEAVEPALHLLYQSGFTGAETEFAKAQEHYRHGRYEDAMTDALKAFESTMKCICDVRGWVHNPDKDTANELIKIVLREGLIPKWAESEFTGIRTILESGVPTARNRNAGHGQGSTVRQVPDYLAAFTLHMAAANIVFLAEAHKAQP